MKKGQCLCGKVSFTIAETDMKVDACHCDMCRKWTAGPFLAISAGKGGNIRFENPEAVTAYVSSPLVERGFCKTCGSSLFYHNLKNDLYYVAVDLLEDSNGAVLVEEIFYDKKPAYYSFSQQTKKLTASEVMAGSHGDS